MDSNAPQENREIPPTPPKKRLSTGALIAIIVSSIVGFFFLVTIVVLVVVLPRIISFGSSQLEGHTSTDKQIQKDTGPKTTYESSAFTFSYPDAWKQKDTSNQTTIVGGETLDTYVVILSDDADTSSVIITYTYNKGSEAPVDTEKARSAMKTALQVQKDASQRQLLSMRESTGHGCATNFKYTTEPAYQEKGDLIGYTYGFTCDSYYGPVQGVYGVWYDEYGAQHRLLVSSLQSYWNDHQAELEGIITSAAAR